MLTLSLTDFIDPVPSCAETESLAVLLQRFEAGHCDRLAVVDEQQRPLGWVSLEAILPLLVAKTYPGRLPRQGLGREFRSLDLQQPLREWAGVMQPVGVLPVELRSPDLADWLQQIGASYQTWAVVNARGAYLGLVASRKLVQFLWGQAPPSFSAPADSGLPPPPTEPVTEPEEKSTPPPSPLDRVRSGVMLLVQALEHVPLPLMVQTGSGQVLAQNEAWRQQVGELQDLSGMTQAVSRSLHPPAVAPGPSRPLPEGLRPEPQEWILRSVTPPPRESSDAMTPWLESLQGKQRLPVYQRRLVIVEDETDPKLSLPPRAPEPELKTLQDRRLAGPPELERGAWRAESGGERGETDCQTGPDPNSCTCVCPAKDGQEQVWKFTRIALPLGMSELESLSLQAVLEPESRFQLANLGQRSPEDWLGMLATLGAEPLWLVLAQDRTEQQQVARELAAKNADLLQLNRLKDEFLACISHELKTPLTAVLGLSSLLKEQTLGPLNERQARYAQLIYQSGRHLVTIVNDILDLTRMETGQLDLFLEPVNIGEICQRALQDIAYAYQDGLEGDVRSDRPLPPEIDAKRWVLDLDSELRNLVADEVRLRQMLVNLLSNAVKFTESGGQIGLKVRQWESWVAFTVWDTGIGIPAEKQHLIFQKFQQLENPLTRRFEGTGLGLVLTQRLARLHGGDVTFVSKEGQGSEFTLLLPPLPPRARSQSEIYGEADWADPALWAIAAVNGVNRLVLLVESVPQSIDQLSSQLHELGYRVAIARSGTEALEKTRRLQPCVVLLNPLLPLLSGWDVLTLLKADGETQHIPVVVTATTAEKTKATQHQADGFLTVPVEAEALKQLLAQRVLAGAPLPVLAVENPLTVLVLGLGEEMAGEVWPPKLDARTEGSPWMAEVKSLLQSHHYRLLEVEDLEQADLLVRVWKPDVVLLDPAIAQPEQQLQTLPQHDHLMDLPWVTLTAATTQAVNRIQGLRVFPCLEIASQNRPAMTPAASLTLLQALQIAARQRQE